MRGRIVKGIAGFYYVRMEEMDLAGESGLAGDAVFECKAKGVFRKDGQKPLVGDAVEMDVSDRDKRLGTIRKILPRHSELIRPAVANVDQALVIFSSVRPKPNFNLLDRFLIGMGRQEIPCIICFNKQDIDGEREGEGYRRIYEKCGYRALSVSALHGEGIDDLKALLADRVTVVAGPSGVGKSSIVNCLQSETVMETGEISAKIERGRHTTRHSELIGMGGSTYIMDTPGFSAFGLFDLEKEALSGYYPEFAAFKGGCRFGGCSHTKEPVCGVKDAVAQGGISKMRYENYCLLYEELSRTARKGRR